MRLAFVDARLCKRVAPLGSVFFFKHQPKQRRIWSWTRNPLEMETTKGHAPFWLVLNTYKQEKACPLELILNKEPLQKEAPPLHEGACPGWWFTYKAPPEARNANYWISPTDPLQKHMRQWDMFEDTLCGEANQDSPHGFRNGNEQSMLPSGAS